MDNFLMRLLDNRERIYHLQKELTEKFNKPIISFMLNTPGLEKRNEKLLAFHKIGIDIINETLGEKVLWSKYYDEDTGMYFLASIDMDSKELKKKMIEIEETEVGRLFDIDVFDENFNQLTRSSLNLEPRKCLVCDDIAKVCIKKQKHSYETLIETMNSILEKYI